MKAWGHAGQVPPDSAWTTWLCLGGRGSGKTFAGASWLCDVAKKGMRFALVGATLHDVREVMIDGPSGVKWIPGGGQPWYEPSRRRCVWPNGGVAYAFSAEDPDSLRGPQFHAAWADEFCAWRHPEAVLSNLRMGLRLDGRSRLCVTTTPKPLAALRRLMAEPGIAVTRSATSDNRHLPEGFAQGLEALYGGTRLARQELEGLVLEGSGGLWRAEELARVYGPRPVRLDEVVVAVDPSVSARGDACGIVVAGRLGERGYVLRDASVEGFTPSAWAARVGEVAREAFAAWGRARVVAEANQGGEMIRSVLASAGCGDVHVELVHARMGKRLRAEPVAALYEQGRVTHCPPPGERFTAMEEEMLAMGCGERGPSPDRADALVWALSRLLVDRQAEPRLRVL